LAGGRPRRRHRAVGAADASVTIESDKAMLMRCLKALSLLIVAGCVTAIVAVVLASSAAAQARLAALPVTVAAPADNPTTPERVELGRLLFWDPILSGQKDVA